MNEFKTPSPDLQDEFAKTINDALIIVASFTWIEALKSLFAENGIFYKAGVYGPWIIAVFATIFAALARRYLRQHFDIPEKK